MYTEKVINSSGAGEALPENVQNGGIITTDLRVVFAGLGGPWLEPLFILGMVVAIHRDLAICDRPTLLQSSTSWQSRGLFPQVW